MNLFQPGPFQPILFQTGGAPTARSGVYRMLLAQAQEEAVQAEQTKKNAVNAALEDAKVKKRKEQLALLAEERELLKEEEEENALDELPPVRLKPMMRQTIVEVPDIGPVARGAAEELGGWMKAFHRAATDYAAMIKRLQERLEVDVAKYRARQKRLRRAALLAALA